MTQNQIKRGEVYNINLDPVKGSEEGGYRPAVIVQNDRGNETSNTTVIIPLSSKEPMIKLLHIPVDKNSGLYQDSIALVEHIRTIDKSRIGSYITALNKKTMHKIARAILYLLSLENLNAK